MTFLDQTLRVGEEHLGGVGVNENHLEKSKFALSETSVGTNEE